VNDPAGPPYTLLVMEPSGPIPFRAAAAYGVPSTRPSVAPRPMVAPGEAIRPAVVDIVETTSTRVEGIRRLVAGTVRSDINRGIGFDEDGPRGTAPRPAVPRADGTLHLYNRQADRMEAATGVAIGRSLDVQG
jgi:hypothetical protein